jgi:threonine/homoserine efflux transporter RhtA
MNAIQKAGFAASALAITLVGAAFVTAPMAFAQPEQVVAQPACSTLGLQVAVAGHVACQGASPEARLVAFNRR